jgi:hypothetical protein
MTIRATSNPWMLRQTPRDARSQVPVIEAMMVCPGLRGGRGQCGTGEGEWISAGLGIAVTAGRGGSQAHSTIYRACALRQSSCDDDVADGLDRRRSADRPWLGVRGLVVMASRSLRGLSWFQRAASAVRSDPTPEPNPAAPT